MNWKFICAIAITLIFMSCSKSTTTAPEEQKMYVFQATDSLASGAQLSPIEMSKDNNGIWQAIIIVPSTRVSTQKNFYFILISQNAEIKKGVIIYGDTLAQTGSWLATKPDTISFPFTNKTLKSYTIGIITPTNRMQPIKVMRIPRPDTLMISFNPVNYVLSVQ